MMDIVIPAGNEKEFALTAKRLCFKGICFLYSFNDFFKDGVKIEGIETHKGLLISSKDFEKAKSKIRGRNIFVAIKSTGDDRNPMKELKSSVFFSFEEIVSRDFMHQRGSGLNHILCRLAKENSITIGFSLKSILNSANPSMILGRMMQNISLCSKFKVKTAIASFASSPYEMRSPHDLEGLFRLLGHQNPEFLKFNN